MVDWMLSLYPGLLPINLQFLPQCTSLSPDLGFGHVTCWCGQLSLVHTAAYRQEQRQPLSPEVSYGQIRGLPSTSPGASGVASPVLPHEVGYLMHSMQVNQQKWNPAHTTLLPSWVPWHRASLWQEEEVSFSLHKSIVCPERWGRLRDLGVKGLVWSDGISESWGECLHETVAQHGVGMIK